VAGFSDVPAAKRAMRRRLLDTRGTLPAAEVEAHAEGVAAQARALPELAAAETVAAYYSVGGEPGTRPLLAELLESGRRVLLPVVTADLDLDWAELDSLDDLATARMGLREPTGTRLGTDAIGSVDLVLCPGLAVDGTGVRLGRGAGCYDRALRRAGDTALRCVLVYDHELVESVPGDRHDERVHVAVTPTRALRLGDGPS
jgi:5-formyltetrahydrofolate cyclo-ligase